jgi:hypothetical protein
VVSGTVEVVAEMAAGLVALDLVVRWLFRNWR